VIDPDTFRSVLGRFASGVTVLTARDADGADHGMTVSAFCALSLEPPLVVACIGHIASMAPVMRQGGAEWFGISILATHQEAISRRFADPETDEPFDGLGYARGESGVVLLDDAIAHLECRVVERHEGGDHHIVIGAVEHARPRQGRPLIYFRGGYTQLEQ
jgi:flavin reductase (DIM6/NTAB) family NADH-FMN oxidoreductase RutF